MLWIDPALVLHLDPTRALPVIQEVPVKVIDHQLILDQGGTLGLIARPARQYLVVESTRTTQAPRDEVIEGQGALR